VDALFISSAGNDDLESSESTKLVGTATGAHLASALALGISPLQPWDACSIKMTALFTN
jgi:hypothetical protein